MKISKTCGWTDVAEIDSDAWNHGLCLESRGLCHSLAKRDSAKSISGISENISTGLLRLLVLLVLLSKAAAKIVNSVI